jgi:hypothetical protein
MIEELQMVPYLAEYADTRIGTKNIAFARDLERLILGAGLELINLWLAVDPWSCRFLVRDPLTGMKGLVIQWSPEKCIEALTERIIPQLPERTERQHEDARRRAKGSEGWN